MKNLMILAVLFFALVSISSRANAQVKTEIEKANKAGNVVFLVVTDGNNNVATAKSIAEKANKSFNKSKVIIMDKNDKANSELVSKYRLLGAPIPLILVVGTNGVVVGGAPANQLKAEDLVNMLPSPKLEQVYDAINKGKHVIVVFTKKSFNDRSEVLKNAKEAISQLKDAEFIEVDINDSREIAFMKQLRVDNMTTKASVTIVINKQGQVAGTSTTIPDVAKLVSAAKTPVKSGCGPGCGPSGCGK